MASILPCILISEACLKLETFLLNGRCSEGVRKVSRRSCLWVLVIDAWVVDACERNCDQLAHTLANNESNCRTDGGESRVLVS